MDRARQTIIALLSVAGMIVLLTVLVLAMEAVAR